MALSKKNKLFAILAAALIIFGGLAAIGFFFGDAEGVSDEGIEESNEGGFIEFTSSESIVALSSIPPGAIPVSTPADLQRVGSGQSFGGYTWSLNAYYYQTANITLSGLFTPIGTSSSPFAGTYNGQGYEIKGLAVNSTGESTGSLNGAGLFLYVNGATLTNINLVNANVIGGIYHTGGIAATAINSTISNCVVSGVVRIHYTGSGQSPGGQCAGGIAGVSYNSTIEKCINYASVTLLGRSGNNSGTGFAGGIVGGNATSTVGGTLTVSQCANYGSIYANTQVSSVGVHALAGGIVGMAYGGSNFNLVIKDCFNSGSVSTHTSSSGSTSSLVASGGILGGLRNGSLGGSWIISNCYSTGEISAVRQNTSTTQNMPGAGGIVGTSNQIGSGTATPGGNVSIVNCYFLQDTIYRNGSLFSNVLIGRGDSTIDGTSVPARQPDRSSGSKTNGQMQPNQTNAVNGSSIFYTGMTNGNVPGWNFNNIWIMNGSYPQLRDAGLILTPLEILSSSTHSILTGTPFSHRVVTNYPTASISVSNMPSWLLFDGTDVIFGNHGPLASPVTYSFTVHASYSTMSVSQNISVIVNPQLTFTTLPTVDMIVVGNQFIYTGEGATELIWDFGDGTVSTEWSPYHVYAHGEYALVLTAINEVGSVSATFDIIVTGEQEYREGMTFVDFLRSYWYILLLFLLILIIILRGVIGRTQNKER